MKHFTVYSLFIFFFLFSLIANGGSKFNDIRHVDGNKTTATILVYDHPALNGKPNFIFTNSDSKSIPGVYMNGQTVQHWNNYRAQESKISEVKAGDHNMTINNTMSCV